MFVKGTKTGLPYSKGLLASSVQAVGLEAGASYRVAEKVERLLRSQDLTYVTVEQLRDVTAEVLTEELGEEAAERYMRWQHAQERERPLLVLIGGPTGGGKSTVATQVAQRLGINRIISTDAIREVMRATVSSELLPSLHVSSYETAGSVGLVPTRDEDPLIAGFLRQTQAVAVGVQHLLERAVEERMDTVVEGVHMVPGTLDLPDDAIVVHLMLTVGDPERHRSHLSGRSQDNPHRTSSRYLDHFEEIRRIHDELLRRAEEADVPVVPSYALDQTVAKITSLIVDTVTAHQREEPSP